MSSCDRRVESCKSGKTKGGFGVGDCGAMVKRAISFSILIEPLLC